MPATILRLRQRLLCRLQRWLRLHPASPFTRIVYHHRHAFPLSQPPQLPASLPLPLHALLLLHLHLLPPRHCLPPHQPLIQYLCTCPRPKCRAHSLRLRSSVQLPAAGHAAAARPLAAARASRRPRHACVHRRLLTQRQHRDDHITLARTCALFPPSAPQKCSDPPPPPLITCRLIPLFLARTL